MVRRPSSRFALLLVIGMAGIALSCAPADERSWTERMSDQIDSASFSVDFEGSLATSRLGQMADVGISGNLTRSGRRHARGNTVLDTQAPDGDEMTFTMLHVADGETLWTEASDPTSDQTFVTKVPLAEADASGTGLDIGQHGFDPVLVIARLAEDFNLEPTDRSGGRVTLEATLDGDDWARLRITQGIPPHFRAEFDHLRLVLEEETALPVEVQLGRPESPFLELRLSNFVPLDDPDPATFAYVPPIDAEVQDLETGAAGD